MAKISNISSLISPNLVNSAKNNLPNKPSTSVTTSVVSNKSQLEKQLRDLNQQANKVNKEYDNLIKKTQEDPNLSQEEKNQQINNLQQQRQNELNVIQKNIADVNGKLSKTNVDPLKSAKEEETKINKRIRNSISKSKKGQRRASLNRLKQIQKSIPNLVAAQLTNVFIRLVEQNGKLQDLVDRTNEVIDNATTPEQISNAIVLRNNALTILTNQEQRILTIRQTLDRLQRIIQIFTLIIRIIERILRLPSPIPIPPPIKITLQPVLQRLLKILEALNIVLNIAIPILDSILIDIEDLKSQLRDINNRLDDNAANNLLNLNTDILGNNSFGSNQFPPYKGFRFALKEENNPKFVIRGNKRHFAVAINTDNVEILKSEPSFTLDPNDLIEQLKLIIDQQNLQS